ncbi:premelanosome protein a isoform X2 [Latimeria chalumnae]|uniref:premelanosome protein a isoform X2 n=1 Tax=Latimeria chalumnae TaxID=7897 RepID=UPI0003C14D29|nr:PREDICTED: melanocyte protein PMEL isoform X2 [Latimeria chalumnae]|eukprot:XP_005986277.1 PREDICTED: melanocyte protein PMEL isoform X2 [Latimeria chalumnae]
MSTVRSLATFCLFFTVAVAQGSDSHRAGQNRSGGNYGRGRHSARRPWNSEMYPVWKEGDHRYQDCWKGGQVSFEVNNDAPTLTGAKASFSIQLKFPGNQTVLPDGQVVWAQNCTVNGTHMNSGEPVYPDETSEGSKCVFPDGRPFPNDGGRRHSRFVYVWQALGKYWQVVDGPSSGLSIETADVPLGSYAMEVVIYHYRGHQKFIPMGRAMTQFTITDQIPFSVEMFQVNDVNRADSNFIQNRAVAFRVQLHDPSQYLQDSDISFSWEFGDQSGTLISRTSTVTHTYLSAGTFQPQLILQAAIPSATCGTSGGIITMATTGATGLVTLDPTVQPATGAAAVTSGSAVTPTPAQPTAQQATTLDDPTVAPATGSDPPVPPTTQQPTPEPPVSSAAPAEPTSPSAIDIPAPSADPQPLASTPRVIDLAVASVAPATTSVPEASPAGDPVTPVATDAQTIPDAQSLGAEINDPSTTPIADMEATTINTEVFSVEAAVSMASQEPVELAADPSAPVPVAETEVAEEALILVKRQAPENPEDSCLIYRFGTFSTDLNIVQGIESVEIVDVVNIVELTAAEVMQNAVDLTVTCQGSLPSEVCTVISDPDCITPQRTDCNEVAPVPECQLVVRQFFNSTGVYCVNVSLTNDVSLAVASTRVSVGRGQSPSFAGGMMLFIGILVVIALVGIIAFTYRQARKYSPLVEDPSGRTPNAWIPNKNTINLFLRNMFTGQSRGESSPLLRGRIV